MALTRNFRFISKNSIQGADYQTLHFVFQDLLVTSYKAGSSSLKQSTVDDGEDLSENYQDIGSLDLVHYHQVTSTQVVNT